MFCCFLEENIVEIVENGGGVSIRYKNLGLGVYIIVSLEGGGCDKYGFGGWIWDMKWSIMYKRKCLILRFESLIWKNS